MKIQLSGKWETRQIWLNGRLLKPEKSQKIRNHSPDGFSWGYAGSGPSQLALAICLELFDIPIAVKMYQEFKERFITTIPQDDFDADITYETIHLN